MWEFLKELLLWIPRKIWQLLLEGLAAVINAIPVPAFFDDIAPAWNSAASSLGYLVSGIGLETAMGIIASAYVLRFVIRRLPVVG